MTRAQATQAAPPPQDADAWLARLTDVLRPRQRVIVAYSGGIDSTLVAAAALQALGPQHVLAAIGDSPSLPRIELAQAQTLADELGVELAVVQPGEIADPDYRANRGDRCYHCKKHLYAALGVLARQRGFRWIAGGTNADDLGDDRPGLIAANEAGIISPLLEAGMGKAAVRLVSAHLGLPNADKPASACLASRVPVGTVVEVGLLGRIEKAEAALVRLGFRGGRVRDHGRIARIELPPEQLARAAQPGTREALSRAVLAAGYEWVTLDLQGYRPGGVARGKDQT